MMIETDWNPIRQIQLSRYLPLSMPFCVFIVFARWPTSHSRTETLHRLHQWRPTIINLSPTPENNKKQQMKIKGGNSSEEHFSPSQLVTWWWKRGRRRKGRKFATFFTRWKTHREGFFRFPFSFCCCSFDSFRLSHSLFFSSLYSLLLATQPPYKVLMKRWFIIKARRRTFSERKNGLESEWKAKSTKWIIKTDDGIHPSSSSSKKEEKTALG